jgi:hypothetical protein
VLHNKYPQFLAVHDFHRHNVSVLPESSLPSIC